MSMDAISGFNVQGHFQGQNDDFQQNPILAIHEFILTIIVLVNLY